MLHEVANGHNRVDTLRTNETRIFTSHIYMNFKSRGEYSLKFFPLSAPQFQSHSYRRYALESLLGDFMRSIAGYCAGACRQPAVLFTTALRWPASHATRELLISSPGTKTSKSNRLTGSGSLFWRHERDDRSSSLYIQALN